MLVGSTIGPFEIERELGSGAMGTVYMARYRKDDEKAVEVALKVVALGLLGNDGAMARFDREATILKQLRHPNIVRLLATGRYRQTPFIAMEYIDGEALDTTLARRGRFSWEEVVTFGRQLCAALQHAHEKGIIHRDLKPSNLMLTKDRVLKLTDFGIAKDQDVTALTGANSTIGTASYMSPEQCKGDRNLTAKSDLYSLGIVFFELITGRKPFVGDSTVDMFLKHVNEEPPRLAKIVPEVPAKLDALIMQLMEKDKDDRPVDAAWVSRMLQEVEEDAFARQSVGLDVATGRRGARKSAEEKGIDDADREAARALKGKKRKKAKKDDSPPVPWHQRKSFQAGAIVSVLLLIAAGLYFAFKPAGQAALHAGVANAKGDEARLEAADRYLAAYGATPGAMTEDVQKQAREIRVNKRDEVLLRRFMKGMAKPDDQDDPKAYQTAWLAMESEKSGDLKAATDLWDALGRQFANDAGVKEPMAADQRTKAIWAWVASKRAKDIQQANDLLADITQKLRDERIKENFKTYPATEPRGFAVRAVRLELMGDKPRSRTVWDMLAAQTEPQANQHEWFLLASQRRRMIPTTKEDQAMTERVTLLAKAIEVAKASAERKNDPVELRQARNGCRDLIDLYEGEPDERIRFIVNESKKLLETLPKSK